MPTVALVTVLISVLIVLTIALALLRVIEHLVVARRTIGTIVVGVQVIAHQTRTVPEALTSVNANLKPVRDFCESV